MDNAPVQLGKSDPEIEAVYRWLQEGAVPVNTFCHYLLLARYVLLWRISADSYLTYPPSPWRRPGHFAQVPLRKTEARAVTQYRIAPYKVLHDEVSEVEAWDECLFLGRGILRLVEY